jgi:hypothetical protein
MVKTSNVVLELPKRTATLDFGRSDDGARTKVRGLFWLTLATVVLGLVVVLASLWKIVSTPSVPSAAPSVPVMVTSAPVACEPESPATPPPEVPATLPPEAPEVPAEPTTPDLEPYR